MSNYLPGNPVTREFEATAHIASAGTGLSSLFVICKGIVAIAKLVVLGVVTTDSSFRCW